LCVFEIKNECDRKKIEKKNVSKKVIEKNCKFQYPFEKIEFLGKVQNKNVLWKLSEHSIKTPAP
jgi:hypothetical protein